jgi:hypothetical protein
MKTVSETLHLQRRGGTWYYYRRTPPDLVSIVGRRFFKRSLKTTSLAEALKLRTVEDLRLDALFSAVAETKALASGTVADYKTNISLDTLIDDASQRSIANPDSAFQVVGAGPLTDSKKRQTSQMRINGG